MTYFLFFWVLNCHPCLENSSSPDIFLAENMATPVCPVASFELQTPSVPSGRGNASKEINELIVASEEMKIRKSGRSNFKMNQISEAKFVSFISLHLNDVPEK